MTNRERDIIRSAVKELVDDSGDFTRGISLLLGLIGGNYPAINISKNLRQVDYIAASQGPETNFFTSWDKAIKNIKLRDDDQFCICEIPDRDIGDDYCKTCHKHIGLKRLKEILKNDE